MMQRWGHARVSSAYEVYLVLSVAPLGPRVRWLWRNLLSIEPPVWGCAEARGLALRFAARGHRVWSWDDRGVVYSESETLPHATIRYRPWRLIRWHLTEPLPGPTAPPFSKSSAVH